MRTKVINILAAVFKLPQEMITDAMALGDTSQWDSLSHMKVILALEQEFQVEFEIEQILGMTNVPRILSAIEQKGCS